MARKNPVVAKIEQRIEDIDRQIRICRDEIGRLEAEQMRLRALLDAQPAPAKRVCARKAAAQTEGTTPPEGGTPNKS